MYTFMTRENFSSAEISLHCSGERPLGERANSRKRIADHIVSNIRIVYIYIIKDSVGIGVVKLI